MVGESPWAHSPSWVQNLLHFTHKQVIFLRQGSSLKWLAPPNYFLSPKTVQVSKESNQNNHQTPTNLRGLRKSYCLYHLTYFCYTNFQITFKAK